MKTKISAYIFLKSLGLTDKKIIHSMGENSFLKNLIKDTSNINAIGKFSETLLNKEANLV